jgi:hypothetical protein
MGVVKHHTTTFRPTLGVSEISPRLLKYEIDNLSFGLFLIKYRMNR